MMVPERVLPRSLTAALLAVWLLGLAVPVIAGGRREDDSRRYTRRLSYGFCHEDQVYFLLEYRVYTPRRPVWFIMPIERSSIVHYHRIFLYRFDRTREQLERLATVQESVPLRTSVQSTKFGERNGRIAFAFYSGSDPERGLIYELHLWDREAQKLVEAEHAAAPWESPEIARYFGDYEGGLADYPGMITISELRNQVLADVPDEEWDLPR